MLKDIYIKYRLGQKFNDQDLQILKKNNLELNDIHFEEKILFKLQQLYFLGANPTADCLIIQNNKILLIQRSENSPACPNMWAIPGGFVNSKSGKGEVFLADEDDYTAAKREFMEETGIDIEKDLNALNLIKFVGVFEGNNRDPRDNIISWTKTYAWVFVIHNDFNLDKNKQKDFVLDVNEVNQLKWFDVDQLPDMAFDHKDIILKALNLINQKKIKP